jgi:hypothetical protein
LIGSTTEFFPQPIPLGHVQGLHYLELEQHARSFPHVAAFTLKVGHDSALTFDVTLGRCDVTRSLRQMLLEECPFRGGRYHDYRTHRGTRRFTESRTKSAGKDRP